MISLGLVIGAAMAPRTLRIALSSPPRPFDPAAAPSAEQIAPVLGAYEQLTSPDGGPELARTWRRDKSGFVWTFQLRPDARFDDGQPVDAKAVKFSLERVMRVGRGRASELIDHVRAVRAIGPMTVEITLLKPAPRLLDMLADPAASIINPAMGDREGGAWLAANTAGSGPYRLTQSSSANVITLVRNPHHPGPRPYFDRVVYTVMQDPTVRALAVTRGDVDIGVLMPSQTLKNLERDPRVRVVSQPVFAFQNLAFNLDRPVFRDVRMRRAVAAAIDAAAIVRDIRGGRALGFQGPLAPGMLGADPALYPVRYDPALARRLAREVGAAPRTISMIYPGVSPETDTVAQYIQAVLAPLGLRVRLERLSTAAYLDRTQRGAYDLVLMGWVCNNRDPSCILDFWFDPSRDGISNPARYGNAEVTGLIRAASVEADPARRASLHRAIAQRVNRDLPYVYLQQTRLSMAVRRDIEGYSMDPVRALDMPFQTLRRR